MNLIKIKNSCDYSKEVTEELNDKVNIKIKDLQNNKEIDSNFLIDSLQDIKQQIENLDDNLFEMNGFLHEAIEKQDNNEKSIKEYVLAVDFLIDSITFMIESEQYNKESLLKKVKTIKNLKIELKDIIFDLYNKWLYIIGVINIILDH